MSAGSVLLVSANCETVPLPVYPLALARLAGALREEGHEVAQFDAQVRPAGELARLLGQSRFDLVGLSIRNIDNTDSASPRQYVDEHRRLVKLVREHADAPIVVGGSGFSLFPDELMAQLGADYGVVGAGERPLCQLMAALSGEMSVESVCNLLCAGRGGAASPPAPGRSGSGFSVVSHHAPELVAYYRIHGGAIGIQTKRGCPKKCCYCTYPLLEGDSVEYAEPGQVVDDMERLARDFAVPYFFMTDSVFNLCAERELALADEIRRRGLGVSWGAFFAPKNADRNYVRALKESGLMHAEFGTDSLSNAVLSAYGKDFSVADVLDASAAFSSEGVFCAHYLAFGGPGETRATIEETLANVARLGRSIIFPFAGIRIYPGTRLFARAVERNMVRSRGECLNPVFYFEDGLDATGIWEMIRGVESGDARWVSPSEYAGFAPIVRRLRERGASGPLWEYLLA